MEPIIEINLITKNPGKLYTAKNAFSKYGIGVNQIAKDFHEIQANTSLEIARHTAILAAKELKIPVVREDHSLTINALGVPGPYISFTERNLPVHKLLEILSTQKDRSGSIEIATVYAEMDGFTLEYSYTVPIFFKDKIVIPDPRNGWDGILMLENETRAFTEYPEIERVDVWNKNFIAMAEFLIKKRA